MTNDLIEYLKNQLLKRDTPSHIFANPKDLHHLAITLDGDNIELSIPITSSPYIEEGTTYVINSGNLDRIKNLKIPGLVPYELEKRIQNDIYAAFGMPRHLFEEEQWIEEREYNWYRFPDETLLSWGDRLVGKGLLDNYEIRWEYQKEVLSTPVRVFKRVLERIKK